MSMYDNLPYELQSPTWRNVGNKMGGDKSYNAGLDSDFTLNMLNASREVARNNSQGVNTSQVDGSAGFLGNLGNFGAALLNSIGGQAEPEAQYMQAGYSEKSNSGIDLQTLLMLGAVGAGVYFLVK